MYVYANRAVSGKLSGGKYHGWNVLSTFLENREKICCKEK